MTADTPPKVRLYIHEIGISALPQRIELTVNSLTPEVLERAERVACNLLDVLPHTPLGPLGINFNFIEEAPPAALIDKLRTVDEIEQHFRINTTALSNQIAWGDDVQLNFTRRVSDAKVGFDFNFNYSRSRKQPVRKILENNLGGHLDQSKHVLETVYGIEEFGEPLEFELPTAERRSE